MAAVDARPIRDASVGEPSAWAWRVDHRHRQCALPVYRLLDNVRMWTQFTADHLERFETKVHGAVVSVHASGRVLASGEHLPAMIALVQVAARMVRPDRAPECIAQDGERFWNGHEHLMLVSQFNEHIARHSHQASDLDAMCARELVRRWSPDVQVGHHVGDR
jgi:hypothetical protein